MGIVKLQDILLDTDGWFSISEVFSTLPTTNPGRGIINSPEVKRDEYWYLDSIIISKYWRWGIVQRRFGCSIQYISQNPGVVVRIDAVVFLNCFTGCRVVVSEVSIEPVQLAAVSACVT
jgi:hypothetical protein